MVLKLVFAFHNNFCSFSPSSATSSSSGGVFQFNPKGRVSAMGRSPCCDKATVKRGTWSPEEDEVLRNYVEKHGRVGNWISLPRKAGLKRCGKSCRLRWLNYLRPEIKRGNFTEEEENLIFSLYDEIGSRWSAIASNLPGRTDNDVKNLWNTKLKKRLPNRETTSINFGKTSQSKAYQTYDHGSSSSQQFTMSSNFEEKNDQHPFINSFQISESKPMIVSDLPSFSSSVEAASSFSTTSSPLPWHQMLAPWSISEADEEEDELLLSWLFQTL